VQVTSSKNDDFFEDLNYETTKEILLQLSRGTWPKAGPQSKRKSSEPASGLTSLKEKAV
jgi:hypothetical protein